MVEKITVSHAKIDLFALPSVSMGQEVYPYNQ
jgi:hypothetical protein